MISEAFAHITFCSFFWFLYHDHDQICSQIKYHLFLVTTAPFLTRRFLSSTHLANSLTTVCLCGIKREGAKPEESEEEEPIIAPRQRKDSSRTSMDGDF